MRILNLKNQKKFRFFEKNTKNPPDRADLFRFLYIAPTEV